MLPPPGIRLSDPEGIEACLLAGLRHGNRFLDRLHAELQNADVERNSHEPVRLPSFLSLWTAETELIVWGPSCFALRRSEEHTSELQSQSNLVCRLLLEKKN